ncbi:MAG: DM13 domain-containing protein, partial [Chloroflexota bacterium]
VACYQRALPIQYSQDYQPYSSYSEPQGIMDLRFRLILISAVGIFVVLAWTVPEWWALANPESPVAQGLPGLEMEARAQFDALPNPEQQAYFAIFEGDEDVEREPQPEWALALVRARFFGQDSMAPNAEALTEAPAGSVTVATGEWLSIDDVRQAEGEITVFSLPDGLRQLRLNEEFTSTRAPDIHIVATRNPDPLDENGVGFDYIDIGTLVANTGAQAYTIPETVDFTRYPVMALYSVEFDQVLATLTVVRLR